MANIFDKNRSAQCLEIVWSGEIAPCWDWDQRRRLMGGGKNLVRPWPGWHAARNRRHQPPCLHTLLNTNISCKNGKFNLILRIFFSLFFITFWNWGWDDVKANLRSSMMMPLDCTSVIPSRTIGPLGQSWARAHNSRMKVRPRRRRSYLLQHLISAPFFRHLG